MADKSVHPSTPERKLKRGTGGDCKNENLIVRYVEVWCLPKDEGP
jgi:hypothetical protein